MNLQNIIVDFNENFVSTMYENKHHLIGVMEEALVVRQEFQDFYGVSFDRVVIQLTEDQHGCEPRILCQSEDNQSVVTFAEMRSTNLGLLGKLQTIRGNIENMLSMLPPTN
jgi:hypothetical protein